MKRTLPEWRPTFIVAEPEPVAGLSTRKLLLEAGGKFNLFAAHNAQEAVDTLQKFPNVDACLIHTQLPGAPPDEVIKDWKKINRDLPVIALCAEGERVAAADHVVGSHESHALLLLLRSLFGDPRSPKAKKGEPESLE